MMTTLMPCEWQAIALVQGGQRPNIRWVFAVTLGARVLNTRNVSNLQLLPLNRRIHPARPIAEMAVATIEISDETLPKLMRQDFAIGGITGSSCPNFWRTT